MSADPKKFATATMDETVPGPGREAVPVLLIGLFALLFFWGLTYVDDHGGGFSSDVYQPFNTYFAVDERNKAAHPSDPSISLGKQVFAKSCVACHMADGMGSTTVGAPPLAGSDWVQAEGPNRIIRIALSGITGPITVSGKQYGTGTMVPFKDTFSDAEIAAALTYVRQAWGNKAGPVKPEQVKAIRAATAGQSGSWTAADLMNVPEK